MFCAKNIFFLSGEDATMSVVKAVAVEVHGLSVNVLWVGPQTLPLLY